MYGHVAGIDAAKNDFKSLHRSRGRIYPSGTTHYHQGDSDNEFYHVNSGVVMVYRLLKNSQRQITGFYTDGDFFGLSSHDTHNDTAVTLTSANITALSKLDLRNSIGLQEDVLNGVCVQLEAAQSLILTLTKKTASEKVAYVLVMLAEKHSQNRDSFDLNLPMSRRDIADYLGLTIETVSRRMTALKTKKIISIPDRNTVRILKYSRLKDMVAKL